MNTNNFNQFLNQISEISLPVVDAQIPLNSYIPIDISENNTDLLNFNVASAVAWEMYITSYLSMHKKLIAFGGYIEKEISMIGVIILKTYRKARREIFI